MKPWNLRIEVTVPLLDVRNQGRQENHSDIIVYTAAREAYMLPVAKVKSRPTLSFHDN